MKFMKPLGGGGASYKNWGTSGLQATVHLYNATKQIFYFFFSCTAAMT
jgi:hypothetical protein